MNELVPFETLFDATQGQAVPLPPALSSLYGRLLLLRVANTPFVLANFVTSLDGVVSLNEPGQAGGGEISGYNRHDAALMGLLRAVADVVIVGAGTARAVPDHLWTPDFIFPPLADAYRQLRLALGKTAQPLNVIVTARGEVDLALPVFRSGAVETLIVTTTHGARALAKLDVPSSTAIAVAGKDGTLDAGAILAAVARVRALDTVLVEGGPHLVGDFLVARRLHNLFLTLSPLIAGRDASVERIALVEGKRFAPESPLWGTLVGTKRAGSHLFLRYSFPTWADDVSPVPIGTS
ncbi:MAG: dihydrofolate reductase family protein [Chloroflexota bacterium]